MSVKVMAVVWDSDLPPELKFVLLAYADHADHDGENVFPAVALIAKKTGRSERTVQRTTRKLEGLGWLVDDGKGPKGTNKWKVPLDVGGDTVTPHVGRGDIHDKEGVTSETQGVTSETSGGDTGDTRTIINHQEPSVNPSINGKEAQDEIRKQAEIDFKKLTKLELPRLSEQSELWWAPLREVCVLSDWNPNIGEWLMFESMKRLEKQGMTISSPKSIIKTVRAIKAERDRGVFKQYNQPKGMTGLRDWLAQGA